MRSKRRSIAVFSISALDLFAAALGAFILIVLVLFPYYKLGGTDVSMEELEEQVRKRRFAAESEQTDLSAIRAIQSEIRLLNKQYLTTETQMSETEAKLQEVLKQMAEVEIPDPQPQPEPVPDPEPIVEPDPPEPPRSINRGVPFSILGLSTDKRDVVILVDMSGSMQAHRQNVVQALNEILSQMKPDNRFAIIGYRGGPTFDSFPNNERLVRADAVTLDRARRFVDNMPSNFGGGTPTQNALIRTLNLKPEAVILISDGQPDDGQPGRIVQNVTSRNRGRVEIHTVAIGDYTSDKALTIFLQELANRNRGEFVGRSR
ncbi:VWA domain-containing protein [Litorimonas sp. WD9-15]|uniref:VWA domain-containing protein n=1 Tax=Litorimonas sp. WD9-15 TaxID=3418716 RepID=UPI003CFC16F7